MLLIHHQAAAALTLKCQRAAKAAHSPANNSDRGGPGGNLPASSSPADLNNPLPASVPLPPILPPSSPLTSPPNPHPGWSQLRAALPERLQAKIAAAEQERKRQQQRENQRRRLAELRLARLPIDTSPEALAALERELESNRLSRLSQSKSPYPGY